MAAKGLRRRSVFHEPKPGAPAPGGRRPEPVADAAGRERRPGKTKKPARPLVELEARLAAEKQRSAGRVPLSRRVARLFPLFGVIGIRELGLAVALAGGVLCFWRRLRPIGLLLGAVGLLIMRYGEGWVKGTER